MWELELFKAKSYVPSESILKNTISQFVFEIFAKIYTTFVTIYCLQLWKIFIFLGSQLAQTFVVVHVFESVYFYNFSLLSYCIVFDLKIPIYIYI